MKSIDDCNFEIEVLSPELNFCDLCYKIIVIGDSGVGKSCLAIQAIQNKFVDLYRATVGFEFLSFNLRINKVVIKLQIWDTCGQEVYKSLISGIYRNSSLAIILYSVTNRNTFQHIDTWIKELNQNSTQNIKIILVGNKSDLEKERKVSYEEGERLKNKHNIDYFIETSAKTGNNAKNVLIEAAKILYKEYILIKDKEVTNIKEEENESKILDKDKTNNSKKKKKNVVESIYLLFVFTN